MMILRAALSILKNDEDSSKLPVVTSLLQELMSKIEVQTIRWKILKCFLSLKLKTVLKTLSNSKKIKRGKNCDDLDSLFDIKKEFLEKLKEPERNGVKEHVEELKIWIKRNKGQLMTLCCNPEANEVCIKEFEDVMKETKEHFGKSFIEELASAFSAAMEENQQQFSSSISPLLHGNKRRYAFDETSTVSAAKRVKRSQTKFLKTELEKLISKDTKVLVTDSSVSDQDVYVRTRSKSTHNEMKSNDYFSRNTRSRTSSIGNSRRCPTRECRKEGAAVRHSTRHRFKEKSSVVPQNKQTSSKRISKHYLLDSSDSSSCSDKTTEDNQAQNSIVRRNRSNRPREKRRSGERRKSLKNKPGKSLTNKTESQKNYTDKNTVSAISDYSALSPNYLFTEKETIADRSFLRQEAQNHPVSSTSVVSVVRQGKLNGKETCTVTKRKNYPQNPQNIVSKGSPRSNTANETKTSPLRRNDFKTSEKDPLSSKISPTSTKSRKSTTFTLTESRQSTPNSKSSASHSFGTKTPERHGFAQCIDRGIKHLEMAISSIRRGLNSSLEMFSSDNSSPSFETKNKNSPKIMLQSDNKDNNKEVTPRKIRSLTKHFQHNESRKDIQLIEISSESEGYQDGIGTKISPIQCSDTKKDRAEEQWKTKKKRGKKKSVMTDYPPCFIEISPDDSFRLSSSSDSDSCGDPDYFCKF